MGQHPDHFQTLNRPPPPNTKKGTKNGASTKKRTYAIFGAEQTLS